jgi:hypothetical protein
LALFENCRKRFEAQDRVMVFHPHSTYSTPESFLASIRVQGRKQKVVASVPKARVLL